MNIELKKLISFNLSLIKTMVNKSNIMLWGIFVFALFFRLYLIFICSDFLNRWGSDDLFYYTQIAGQLSSGGGLTFDGVHLTNGFQPLFLILLLPFGKWMLHDVTASYQITLTLCSFLFLLSSFQFYLLLKKELGLTKTISSVSVFVMLLHPKLLSVTFNGTEASLSFLMIILSFRAFFWMKEQKHLFLSSVIFAGLVITRMDFAFILFLLFAFSVYQKHSFIHWVKPLVFPSLLFSSWLLFNFLMSGDIMPSSGIAKGIHANYTEGNLLSIFASTFSTTAMSESAISIPSIVLAGIGGFYLFTQSDKKIKLSIIGIILICFTLSLVMVLTVKYFRDWYLVPHYILIVSFISFGITYISKTIKSEKFVYILAMVFGCLLWIEAEYSKRNFAGNETVKACEYLTQKIPLKTTLGSFNAGIPQTVLGNQFTIVNLDGVVNNSVLMALEKQELEKYLNENNIHYLLDFSSSIDHFIKTYSSNLETSMIDSVELSNGITLTLMEVKNN